MTDKSCLITGVGPGTGAALARRFARDGYAVAMIARNEERLSRLEEEIDGSKGYICDVGDADQLSAVVKEIIADNGCPDVVVHNAVGGAVGDFLSISADTLERNFQINTMALFHLGKLIAPEMIERRSGVILCTGNTSAYRGKANFAGFAPTKAAQRILLEAMARRLGPEGIHVAYIAIDAVIDVPWTRQAFSAQPDEFFCKPADIADECYRIALQPKSAWSSESVIRPYVETW